MSIQRKFVLAVLVIFLSACSSLYVPKRLFNGYSEVQLGKNLFVVNFQGDGFDPAERLADFVLLRSAEVALENGFNYFVIGSIGVNNSGAINFSPLSTPINSTEGQQGGARGINEEYPSRTDTMLCFKEKPDISNGAIYDAKLMADSMKKKYRLE